jgi:hypothetical protein
MSIIQAPFVTKLIEFYIRRGTPEQEISYIVFNEMMMSEYANVCTIDAIQAFIDEYPGIVLNGFAMDELLNTKRHHIIDFFMELETSGIRILGDSARCKLPE